MKFSLPANLVRQSLAGHSWIGLLVSALMYLVCLTGVPVVFMHEIARWEQPESELPQEFSPAMLAVAYEDMLGLNPDYEGGIYFDLPTYDLPRLIASTDSASWLVDNEGHLESEYDQAYTDQLIGLHVNLHLPRTVGVVVVGILGVLLCSLVISGIFAHPRIFREAFRWRRGDGSRLSEADLHNRLSVWNIPFALIIAVSGAFFGVYNFALMGVAYSHNDGDYRGILGTVYGAGVVIDEPLRTPDLPEQGIAIPDFTATLEEVSVLAPENKPFMLTVENANTDGQYLTVAVKHEGRMIYAEEYHLSAAGELLEKHGYSDGPTARQVLISIHSLHLGDYGGLPVKALYAVLGLALSVVAATGFNIWLRRRKRVDWLNHAWPAVVWGTPLALTVAAMFQVLLNISAGLVFWLVLLASTGYMVFTSAGLKGKIRLQRMCAGALVLLVITYSVVFKAAAYNALSLVINLILLFTAGIIAWLSARQKCAENERIADER